MSATLCHMCNGSRIDEDAERAADARNCPNCNGTGVEPEWEDDYETDEDLMEVQK